MKKTSAANPDFGYMRFTYRDPYGNEDRLHVSATVLTAAGGPGQSVPMSFSNYMFRRSGMGTAEKNALFSARVRAAYNASGGNQQNVLDAIREVTGSGRGDLSAWSAHSHDKPRIQTKARPESQAAPTASKRESSSAGEGLHYRDVEVGDSLLGPDGAMHVIASKEKAIVGRMRLKTEEGLTLLCRRDGRMPGYIKDESALEQARSWGSEGPAA